MTNKGFKFITDEEMDAMTDSELHAYMKEMAKQNPPTPEDLARWDKLSKAFVDNLNKNVK